MVVAGGGAGGASYQSSQASGGAGGSGIVVIKELSKASGVWNLKSQLKVRDMKINQIEDENKTMKSELENVKTTLNQSMDDWKEEKSSILGMHLIN